MEEERRNKPVHEMLTIQVYLIDDINDINK